MQEIIAEQTYYKMERRISSVDQIDIEHERTLYLYNDRIISKHREFSIQEIMDVSYRKLGQEGGLLYLHTKRGVFSYTVKSSPDNFVERCKEFIKRR
ncbi:hypothetical protein SAMN05216389_10717 [Oceanobacillus limi]|uniref:PH domain-containing protein n=1 Tax=Oceanobacillus limi TaxID=930131 RepID=A0A1I0CPW5_9BACI|nr:hypothetical protein [Oceanobacillus limi]SET21647.1 hypothetical protein SAMN05216389_10717 [Oceanobacillus limi]